MKKLKKSSALLLIVSFLLSIFSFSAFAAGNTITVNICPRLLSEQQQEGKIGSEGDPGGNSISGAKFSLYKLNNTPNNPEANKSYVCESVDDPNENSQDVFPFDKTKNEHEVEIAGKKYRYYSGDVPYREVVTDNSGVATVTFEDGNSGWYIAIMDDSREKTCLPTFICVNNSSNEPERNVYPKVVNMVSDSNLPGIKKCILGNNEIRYVSKDCSAGEVIDYQVDVNIPKINGFYRGNRSDEYGTDLDAEYSAFSVTDNALIDNDLVEKLADNSYHSQQQVEVTIVSEQDRLVSEKLDPHFDRNQQGDYTLNINGKSLTVDFKRGGEGFSPNLRNKLFQYRNDPTARLRIRFSVKIRDDVAGFLVNKIRGQGDQSPVGRFLNQLNIRHNGHEEINIDNLGFDDVSGGFRKLLRIENTAVLNVQKGINRRIVNSNKVICQFGVLSLRKTNVRRETLGGAEFSLFKTNIVEDAGNISPDSQAYRDNFVGAGEVDQGTGYRYFVFSAGQLHLVSEEDMSRLAVAELNEMAENYANEPVRFYLYETQAPAGYEMMRKPIAVSLSGGFNYQEVVNYPEIKMPFTGGTGTILFTAVGILLIGSGALLYMNFRRKKSAE